MIRVDFNSAKGSIKPLHGVDNAPLKLNMEQKEFKDAGIPFVRTHDTVSGYGGAHYVDIPNIFPNFDADENDEASYDFAFTDAFLKPLFEAGTMPFYRLGVTIENHYKIKAYNIHPPKDFAKWARICEHVVMHYNEGWANGFNWNVKYWEIWNEPENPPMWTGTREQFFELYRVASLHLKKRFPDISVGGYGGCGFYAIDCDFVGDFHKSFVTWFEDFCKFVVENKLPLDFYSWHLYTCEPEQIIRHGDYVRKTLDANGLQKTESIFNEWNFMDRKVPRESFDMMKSNIGASFVAAAFCLMQDGPIDKAMYYDATPTRAYCGLFYFPSMKVTPCYYSFKAFNALYALGDCVASSSDETGAYVCAAKNAAGEKAILLANYSDDARELQLSLEGADLAEFTVYRIDADHSSLDECGKLTAASVSMPPKSVCLLAKCANSQKASEDKSEKVKFAGLG